MRSRDNEPRRLIRTSRAAGVRGPVEKEGTPSERIKRHSPWYSNQKKVSRRRPYGSRKMKTHHAIGLAIISAVGSAALVQGLHAQAKPPVYVVAENDVSNPEAYGKEYAPKMQAL